jgi:hypothetical protein
MGGDSNQQCHNWTLAVISDIQSPRPIPVVHFIRGQLQLIGQQKQHPKCKDSAQQEHDAAISGVKRCHKTRTSHHALPQPTGLTTDLIKSWRGGFACHGWGIVRRFRRRLTGSRPRNVLRIAGIVYCPLQHHGRKGNISLLIQVRNFTLCSY